MANKDNPARRLSEWLDSLFRPVGRPVGNILSGAAREVVGAVSPQHADFAEQQFQHVGENLPRLGAEMALAFGTKKLPLRAAGLGDVLLRTSTEPGADLGTGLGQTAAFAAAPRFGRVGEMVAQRAAAPLERAIASPVARYLAGEGVRRVGAVGSSLVPFEAAGALEAYRRGQLKEHVESLGSPEHLISTAASVFPFEAAHLPRIVGGVRRAFLQQGEPVQEQLPQWRVTYSNGGVPRYRDFGSEDVARDYADAIRRGVGGEPTVEPSAPLPRQRAVYNMAFRPEQLQGNLFGFKSVDLLNAMGDKPLPGKQVFGTIRNKVPKGELDALPGLEAWLGGKERVTPKEVQDWIQENGPRVETKVLKSGEGAGPNVVAARAEVARIEHDLDTLFPGWQRGIPDTDLTPQERSQLSELLQTRERHQLRAEDMEQHRQSGFDPDVYRSIAPKDKDQTVVMVRVPATQAERNYVGEGADRESRRPLHQGQHFGPEDINVLGWARLQYEDVGGKKVAHVIETQSDWGQQIRHEKESIGRTITDPDLVEMQKRETNRRNHPLLRDYNRLVLKAVIDQAIKDGADSIVISDAETAMMTEGHDAAAGFGGRYTFTNPRTGQTKEFQYTGDNAVDEPLRKETDKLVREGWEFVRHKEITQEPGMRLNYDTILPKIAEELTGEKGRKVSLGEHQRALDPEYTRQQRYEEGLEDVGDDFVPGQDLDTMSRYRPNLIFRNPDGSPKTDASGLMFGLSRAKARLAQEGGFSLFGSDRAVHEHVREMQFQGYEPDQILRAAENLKNMRPLKGEKPLQTLARYAGIDPKLFAETLPPEQAFDTFAGYFHHIMGETPERSVYLAKQTMSAIARFAPWLKRVAFAVAPASEGASRIYMTPRPMSPVMQYVVAQHEFPGAKGKRSIESQVFDFVRSAAHESTHLMGQEAMSPTGEVDPAQRQAWIRAMANVEAIPPLERKGVMENMLRLVVPKKNWGEVDKVNMEQYVDSPEEFLADFAAVLAMGNADPRTAGNMRDLMVFGDKASQDFGNAVYKDLMAVFGAVKDFMGLSGQPKEVTRAIGNIHDNLTKMMAAREEAEKLNAMFHGYMERTSSGPLERPPVVTQQQMHRMFQSIEDLNMLMSDALGKRVTPREEDMKILDEVLEQIRPNEARAAGERLTWWRDFIKPMSQLVESLKEKVPSALPIKALGFDYRGLVSESQMAAWSLWQTPAAYQKQHPILTAFTGGIDWKRLRWLSKDGSPAERAFTKLSLAENTRVNQGGATELMTRKEKEDLSAEYKAMSPEDKERIDLSLDQSNAMYKLMAKRQWDDYRDRIVWQMGKVLMSHNKGLFASGSPRAAYELAKEAVGLTFDAPRPSADPLAQIQWAQNKVNFFESLPIPDANKDAFKAAVAATKAPWERLGDQLLGQKNEVGERPGRLFYAPEVRTREWHVNWKLALEGKQHHEAFKTEKEAVARRKEIESEHADRDLEYIHSFNRKDRTERFRGMVQEEISSVQQDALDALYKTTLAAIGRDHPEAQEIIDRIRKEVQPATAFQNIAVSPYMRQREFIPGREKLNMAEGLVRYVDAVSYQMAKRHVKQAGQAVLFNPDMRANPNIRNEFEKYLHFVTDAEGKEFNLLKNLVFANYIGLNPSTMLIEPTQQIVSLVPYMVENGMGVKEAYGALKQANKDILKTVFSRDKLANPEEQKALEEAIQKRTVDTGFTSELYGETDMDFAATRSSVLGSDALGEKVDLLKRPLYQLLAVARQAYGMVTSTNGKVAFLTAFRHARKEGKTYEDAVRFATQATDATMFGGGRANRPIALQRMGSAAGVGGVMYTLGSYTLNMLTQMARLTRKAIQSKLGENTPEGRAAMKAAGTMWATQFALGGVLGLPLVSAGIAVLEQMYPGLDARKAMREGLVAMGGDDEDLGHGIADGAMRGVLNLSGVDFGSRFQLGSLLGVSPYDGFSWRNLAGPAATMFENWFKAQGQASEGRWGDAARTAAPVALKNVLNLIHDDWAVRDKAGRMIGELTGLEKTAAVLGFKPNKLANYYERQKILERSEERKAKEVRDVRTEAAKLLLRGDAPGAQAKILEGLETVGPYDPLDMAREVAQLAQEMASPQGATAGSRANAAEAAEIARLYPKQVGPSELNRILEHAGLLRQLGVSTGRPSITALRKAALVDSLLAQQSELTLPQARSRVEAMIEGRAVRRRRQAFSLQQPR